jgi:hypothetical protein
MPRNKIILIVLTLFLLSSSDLPAALISGTYTLSGTQLVNGSWSEWFGLSGEGNAGSLLNANAASGNQWSLTATSIQDAQEITSGPYYSTYKYSTAYTVLFAFMSPGAWGDAFTLSNAAGTNYSALDSSGLTFLFTTSGIANGMPVQIEALFDSSTAASYSHSSGFHTGSGFKELTLTVVPIPGAVWMLGAGLIGLVAVRRRSK